MKFLKLTEFGSTDPVYINVDDIAALRVHKFYSTAELSTKISLKGMDCVIMVNEPIQTILNLLPDGYSIFD